MLSRLSRLVIALIAGLVFAVGPAAAHDERGLDKLRTLIELRLDQAGSGSSKGPIVHNFRVLGHHDLGASEINGDVWVHDDFAYVGTWQDPCNGRGVKIVDVSDLHHPDLIGTLAAREGTSAEDMVVRSVSTPFFTGDLIGVGIQRCGPDPALDTQQFGLELWDVTNPVAPVKLSELGLTNGGGGVHELDLFQRGDNVYALVATPFSEWFDPVPAGDFRIVDVTNPRAPVQVAEWGAGANSFAPGPFWGQGSFGATFGHSARASEDGTKAYVSYWDIGVLTFDITDVSNPVLVTRTTFKPWEDGDAHSMTPYLDFILQNDEDFDPNTPSDIRYGRNQHGIGTESPGAPPLWLQPAHRVQAPVVEAADQGCLPSDYPADTPGKIAVVRTPVPDFDPNPVEFPLCLQQQQEAAAETAGAVAVVHDFISETTSPQWTDFGSVGIPVLFTDHETAQGMVAAGSATLKARRPSWGYLRVYDAATGEQVAKFDRARFVHELPAPPGAWSIHNTEVVDERGYISWYSNGIVAIDLAPLSGADPQDPTLVGQFLPSGDPPAVWGVAIRQSDNVIFASDLFNGLWIVEPTGPAAPED